MAKVEEGAKGNCNDCGEVKPLPNYPNDSLCASCRRVKKSFDKAWGVVKNDPIALCDDAKKYLESHPNQDVQEDFNCGICDYCHGRN